MGTQAVWPACAQLGVAHRGVDIALLAPLALMPALLGVVVLPPAVGLGHSALLALGLDRVGQCTAALFILFALFALFIFFGLWCPLCLECPR